MKRLGISLVELLVVIGIICLLTALLTAVFVQVKNSAKVSRSISNMRQIGSAIELYRQRWGGAGGTSDPSSLGLPPGIVPLALPKEMYKTGGESLTPGGNNDIYTWIVPYPGDPVEEWVAYYNQQRDNAVVLVDETQNPGLQPKLPTLESRLALGLHLDTHVSKKRKRGAPDAYQFWID